MLFKFFENFLSSPLNNVEIKPEIPEMQALMHSKIRS